MRNTTDLVKSPKHLTELEHSDVFLEHIKKSKTWRSIWCYPYSKNRSLHKHFTKRKLPKWTKMRKNGPNCPAVAECRVQYLFYIWYASSYCVSGPDTHDEDSYHLFLQTKRRIRGVFRVKISEMGYAVPW